MIETRIIVVGGGPGGAVAGFHLARAGFDVTIVERSAFPRVKVCGEFVSPAATALLEAVIGAPELRAAGARRVERFFLELGERLWSWEMPEPAWAFSRAGLDSLLMEKARGAGAAVVQPASVTSVEYGQGGVRVTLADGRRLDGDLVLHADGSGRHDPAGPVRSDRRLIAHKCHLRLPGPLQGVRIRAGPGAYVGTIEVEDGLVTCALVADRRHIAEHHGDADGMLRVLWPGFDQAWRASAWKSCGVARSRYVRPGHVRSFRVGNAAGAVDPIGGEGIGLAVWSGSLLSSLLSRAARAGLTSEALAGVHRDYARAYSRRLCLRLPACRLAAQVLMRPRLCAALWPILAVPGLSVRPWYALTGKTVRAG